MGYGGDNGRFSLFMLRNTALKKFVALACAFVLVLMPRLAWAPYGTGGTLNTGRFADGTVGAPSISLLSATSTGFYKGTAGFGSALTFSQAGTPTVTLGSGIVLGSTNVLTWSSGDASLTSTDVGLFRDAANTLAQRNGTNAQTFRLYNTFTDASNFERAQMAWSGNTFSIQTAAGGTGLNRAMLIGTLGAANLAFTTNNVTRWAVENSNGNFIANTDNSTDIGATGATRPRDIFSAKHFRSEAATVPTMGACGTTPSVTGSDHGLTVTVGAGGVATTCAVNFGVAFTAAPACTANSNTDQTSLIVTTAVGSVTVTKAVAFTAGSKLYIVCMGS